MGVCWLEGWSVLPCDREAFATDFSSTEGLRGYVVAVGCTGVCFLRRRRRQQTVRTTTPMSNAKPPITPPAIAPALLWPDLSGDRLPVVGPPGPMVTAGVVTGIGLVAVRDTAE